MKTLRRLTADALVLLHVLVIIVLLIGWMFPEFKIAYLILLVSVPFSWIVLGYCPVTKWEYLLRRVDNPSLDPNREFITYYTHALFGWNLSSRTVDVAGLVVFCILFVLSLTH